MAKHESIVRNPTRYIATNDIFRSPMLAGYDNIPTSELEEASSRPVPTPRARDRLSAQGTKNRSRHQVAPKHLQDRVQQLLALHKEPPRPKATVGIEPRSRHTYSLVTPDIESICIYSVVDRPTVQKSLNIPEVQNGLSGDSKPPGTSGFQSVPLSRGSKDAMMQILEQVGLRESVIYIPNLFKGEDCDVVISTLKPELAEEGDLAVSFLIFSRNALVSKRLERLQGCIGSRVGLRRKPENLDKQKKEQFCSEIVKWVDSVMNSQLKNDTE